MIVKSEMVFPTGTFEWMVVRFVRVIRVPACARVSRVSRVCPGSPRCLFTGTVPILTNPIRFVCLCGCVEIHMAALASLRVRQPRTGQRKLGDR